MPTADIAVDRIFDLLGAANEQGYIGEPVSQLEHALQCAHFAQLARAAEQEVLAALLHDIGHLCAPVGTPTMAGFGVVEHERIGAELLLSLGVDRQVCELVAGHVLAKRYLASKNRAYLKRLSPASRQTLAFQGGLLDGERARRFESDPLFEAKLRVRSWDELGKQAGLDVAPLSRYEALLRRHL